MNNYFEILTSQSSSLEDKKSAILSLTEERLKRLIKEDNIPQKLEYIVVEVAIKRYNRLSNEGMKSYSQEGLSITFDDNDFAEFMDDINDYLDEIDAKRKSKYKVRFL